MRSLVTKPDKHGRIVLAASLALLGCRAAAGPGPRVEDSFNRLWPALAEGSLAERITDPMVSIRHDQGSAARYQVAALAYLLDGRLLLAQRLDRLRPLPPLLTVYDGRIRPGGHALTVYLTVEETAGGLATAARARVSLADSRAFAISEGQFASVTTRTREYDPARPPGIDFEFQFRPLDRE